jgi:hypothetical protein
MLLYITLTDARRTGRNVEPKQGFGRQGQQLLNHKSILL